jgi:hypothetical protein
VKRGIFGLTPLAILSLSGDLIHNFGTRPLYHSFLFKLSLTRFCGGVLLCCAVDGLVVGAAFVASLSGGVTTAVAIAVHEIPYVTRSLRCLCAALSFVHWLTRFSSLCGVCAVRRSVTSVFW